MELSGKWPVKALCDEMSVNRSGFYKYRARRIAPSERAVKKANDIALFLTFHRKHPSHGYRWLNAKIRLDLGLVMSDEYARRCCRSPESSANRVTTDIGDQVSLIDPTRT